MLVPKGKITSHPMITRFFKGVYELKPPVSKYNEIWDVSLVLNYLRLLHPIQELTLKQITLKLVMLTALTTAQRLQTLHLLDIQDLCFEPNRAIFNVSTHLKQSKPGSKPLRIYIQRYPQDASLDILELLTLYLQKTQPLRKQETKLFISYVPPHKSVSTDTLSRWIKEVMQKSGINIQKYKAHSTRAASVSKASSKFVPVDDILNVAGWKSEKTFAAFYKKDISHECNTFVEALVDS